MVGEASGNEVVLCTKTLKSNVKAVYISLANLCAH